MRLIDRPVRCRALPEKRRSTREESMKALTVCQPFAHAIIHGGKTIENRSWPTSYRGSLLIHAGKSRDYLDFERSLPDGSPYPPLESLAFGAIIGLVQLVDCVPVAQCQGNVWAEGPWCWVLADPRPLAPYPCRGRLSLWQPPTGFRA